MNITTATQRKVLFSGFGSRAKFRLPSPVAFCRSIWQSRSAVQGFIYPIQATAMGSLILWEVR